jgi:hypothetical protein
MFGRGGFLASPTGRNVLGSIGDGLLVASGNKPMFWPQQMQANQEALIGQREQQLAQWKQQHPEPTPMQRNYEYLMTRNPALAQSYLAAEANPQTLMTDPATGAVRFMPKGGLPGMNMSPATSIHPDAIARLKAHPEEAPLFDQQFGPGSAASVLGGAQ